MCRAVKVLCAAADPERLSELKRAAVAAEWELVGGAASLDELVTQLEERRPDVLVLDAGLGPESVVRARAALPSVRVVAIGPLAGADDVASLDVVRTAILGLPRPGGPVR
jgi:DNA-binding NarL/FixJ family response regulator